ncbi:MAG: phosphatidate cytidylyltransferase [Acidimicrobiales bacterium]
MLESTSQDSGWSDLDGPRWHGEDPEWGSEDFSEVFSGVEGVSRATNVAEAANLTFDDIDDDLLDLPAAAGAPQRADRQVPRQPRVRQRPNAAAAAAAASAGERDVTMAIGVGLVMAALALIAIRVSSHLPLLAIVTVAAAVGASEFYLQLRRNGLHPATLLGITAAASVPVSVYYRGEAAYPMVIALTIIFGSIWYVVGADEHKPALNMSLTIFGVGWIGVLGSFAVLLFNAPNQDGHGLLLAAIVVAVASDTGAFGFGRWLGKTPFHPASKNKTWEEHTRWHCHGGRSGPDPLLCLARHRSKTSGGMPRCSAWLAAFLAQLAI